MYYAFGVTDALTAPVAPSSSFVPFTRFFFHPSTVKPVPKIFANESNSRVDVANFQPQARSHMKPAGKLTHQLIEPAKRVKKVVTSELLTQLL